MEHSDKLRHGAFAGLQMWLGNVIATRDKNEHNYLRNIKQPG
jgi:hypothetical protein